MARNRGHDAARVTLAASDTAVHQRQLVRGRGFQSLAQRATRLHRAAADRRGMGTCGPRPRYGRVFPWGDDYSTGYANINETWDNAGECKREQTTIVGTYPQGASSEGVLDLAGNVCEWCLNKQAHPEEIGL